MRIRQYVYFGLFSPSMPAVEMTARLLFEPDEVAVKASRSLDPPRPVSHAWMVVSRQLGLTVDEQLGRIVERLLPVASEIGGLAVQLESKDGAQGGARLQVVRYFDVADGEDEGLSSPIEGLEKLPGQHQLLGWHLDREVLEFIRLTRADLDVDEYG